MRVYIAVDSEGEACITREVGTTGPYGTFQADYNRRRATDEATAAVKGAREAGADDIVVHDCGFIRDATPIGLTLYYDDLPRGIRIAIGGAPMADVAALGFDGAILIGHHAMAGTPAGVMAHTFSSLTVASMRLNGKEIGEIGLESLLLGRFGIPVVLVAGDEAACAEAREWLGDVAVAAVKVGLSTHSAISLHPQDACELIQTLARRAVGGTRRREPLTMQGPFELVVECSSPEQAEARCVRAGGERVGERSYVIHSDEPPLSF